MGMGTRHIDSLDQETGVSGQQLLQENNVSRQEYFKGWNETAAIGLGIEDSQEVTHIVNFCLGIMLVFIGLAGSVGNGLVLYVFTRYRRLRGGGGPLILSLASGDFLVSILHILPACSSFNNKWMFGNLGCSLYAASVGFCGIASLLTLSAIAADRFSVIIGHPLVWLAGFKTCIVIWLASAVLTFPPLFGWSRYCLEGLGTSCSWDYMTRDLQNRLYYIFLLTTGFLLPLSIIITSYAGILWVVCKHNSQSNEASKGALMTKKKPTKNDIKTAQVIFTIIICFLVAWTPYAVTSVIGQFGDESKPLSPMATAIPAIFAKTSVIINPIVYGLSHPQFRSAIRTLRARGCGGNGHRGRSKGNNKAHCRYSFTQSKYGNRYPAAAKLLNFNGICNGNGGRMRRETGRQREMHKLQPSTSTKMMSDMTTTGQNNTCNTNMPFDTQTSSTSQNQLILQENPGYSQTQGIQSISKYCSEKTFSLEGNIRTSMNLPNLTQTKVTKKQVRDGRMFEGTKGKAPESSQWRKQQENSLSQSETCLSLVPALPKHHRSSTSCHGSFSYRTEECHSSRETVNAKNDRGWSGEKNVRVEYKRIQNRDVRKH